MPFLTMVFCALIVVGTFLVWEFMAHAIQNSEKSKYLQRIIHAHHTKDGCEAFGFLIAPKKYEPK